MSLVLFVIRQYPFVILSEIFSEILRHLFFKNTEIMKYSYLTLFICSFCILNMNAQETISAAGGNASGSGGTVAFSVGQVVYTTNTGTNGSVAQGVQQPFEISVITGLTEATGINLSVSAYPNPTTDYLTLKTEDFQFSDLKFQLFDMAGKLIESNKISGNETKIETRGLVPATYFLKVMQDNKEIKTFKIIKN